MVTDLTHYAILFLTGLTAGTVDAIAGGGGLISLPILLNMGIPPHLALGTNKLQAMLGTSMATFGYYRSGWLSLDTVYKGLILGVIGSILGASVGQAMSKELLAQIIPLCLTLILFYFVLTPRLGIKEEKAKMSEFWFFILFGFGLGFYDAFFGPGTGSLWIFFLTFFLGYSMTKATAYTKVFNLKSTVIATICFAIGGNIDYRIALIMSLGQIIGGRLGAYLAVKKGAKLIRPLFMLVVMSTIAVLVYHHYYPPVHRFLLAHGIDPFMAGITTLICTLLIYFLASEVKRQRAEVGS